MVDGHQASEGHLPMVDRALNRIGVEPSERAFFAQAGLCLALLSAAAYALFNASETLFLKRVGVEYLPWVLLASSGLLVLTTGVAGRRLASADRPRVLPSLLLGLAALLVAFWVLLQLWQARAVFGAFVLVARQLLALGLLAVWLALGDLVTGRRAKRLFAPMAAGITVGGILGSFGSDPLARLIGMEGLVLAAVALLLGASLAARRLPGCAPGRGVAGAPAPAGALVPEEIPTARIWRESPLFRLLLASMLCGGLLSPVLYFEFSYLADAATTGPDAEQRLLSLFAQFRGWLNVAMLAFQLWLSARLYHRIGLPLSAALEPGTYLLGFAWLGVGPSLTAGISALGASRLAEDGIAGAARRVLFNLFPESMRSKASGLLEGPVSRLGAVLGNLSVLAAIWLGSPSVIPWIALPIVALWLVAALALWRSYPRLLLRASRERSLVGAESEMATLLDAGTLRALAPSLADPDPRLCRAAVDLVRSAEPTRAVEALAEAIAEAPPETRPLLVDALHQTVEPFPPGSLSAGRAPAKLEEILGGEAELAPEERADLLHSYARLVGGSSGNGQNLLAVLDRALGDPEASVRLVAIAELHRCGRPPPGSADLDALLREAVRSTDVLIRRSARQSLRAMLVAGTRDEGWEPRLALLAEGLESRADRPETAEALVEVARGHGEAVTSCAAGVMRRQDDRDPRVRAAALRFAGHAGLSSQLSRLVAALGARFEEVSDAARDGLVALGPEAAEPLLAAVEAGTAAQRRAVVSVLREIVPDAELLEAFYGRQLERTRAAVSARAALAEQDPSRLVLRWLEERIDSGIGTLCAVVAVLHHDDRVIELEHRLRNAPDERSRDIVVEALETRLARARRRGLLPLLDDQPWTHAGRSAHPMPSAAEAWEALAGDPDPVATRLAGRFSPRALEEREDMGNPLGVIDPMDVAVCLQDAPAFGRLPTRQLIGLAEVLEELHSEAGAEIFAAGDEPDGIYFVYEGEVEIVHGRSVVEQVEPGGFFGELATLDGIPRTHSARAARSTTLLRLDREELIALIERDPALGLGLSQFLCTRVRALMDRLNAD